MAPENDVLLISIDSLRADHISAMGYERETTPFLDGLIKQGMTFERAFSTAGFTLGSVTSFLTSTYPLEYGGYGPLSPDRPSLPEAYQRTGRQTIGIHENGWLTSEYNFDRGFDEYIDLYHSSSISDRIRRLISDRLPHSSHTFRTLKWVDDKLKPESGGESGKTQLNRPPDRDATAVQQAQTAINREKSTFVWVHLMGPHTPYYPPDDYHGLFSDTRIAPEEMASLHDKLVTKSGSLKEQEVQTLVDLYDEEIHRLDTNLQKLIQGIDLDSTTVAIISDHGELFGEYNDTFTHGPEMLEELLHVPLLFLGNGVEPDQISTEVSLINLAPSLLAVSDNEEDLVEKFRGKVLGKEQSTEPVCACSAHRGTHVADLDPSCRRLRVRAFPWKLVRRGIGAEVTDTWYDLRGDSDTVTTSTGPAELAEKMDAFEQRLDIKSDHGSNQISDELNSRLKELGYLK
ncbi:sulfatase-like hydrolase/transferase [Halovivax cerinus]|uniref:Sulfatase-like hydrolase/transferase n=1 Tax=Halovivax cerinus TaxID=1487865 RepID=A0ABD5NJE3_9EURY|nr:sulfatase-like hydrolase/transferase [Halovivax cerinus]